MQTIDFKSELRDPAAARMQAKAVGATHIITVEQTDTCFRLSDGRLIRREAPDEPTEWIFYHRPDRVRPRMSNYTVLSDAQATTRWGAHGLKPWLQVRKTREIWTLPPVRIHVDQVHDLGWFIEFEAQVSRDDPVRECHQAIARLRDAFDPILGESLSVSYGDLIEARREPETRT